MLATAKALLSTDALAIGLAAQATKAAPLNLRTLQGWGWRFGMQLGWGAQTYTALAQLAAESPYASRGLRLIADNAAAAPLVVMEREGDEEVARRDDPTLAGLERFWEELCDAAVWGLFCGGAVYVERIGPSTGPNARGLASSAARLRFWRPDEHVETKRDTAGEPTQYCFRGYKGSLVYAAAADVLELAVYDPAARRGEDPRSPILLGARRALKSLESADTWNRTLAESGGRLEGFMEPNPEWLAKMPGGKVPGDVLKLAQTEVDERLAASKSRGGYHLLSGAYKPVNLSVTPKDADFLKAALKDLRATATVLGVPPVLLADEKGGSLTDAGVDSEVAALWRLTILPFVRRALLARLSRFLLEPGRRFDVDERRVDVLADDVDARHKRTREDYLAGVISLEEAREATDRGDVDPAHTFRQLPGAAGLGVEPETAETDPPENDGPEDEDDPAVQFMKGLNRLEFDIAIAHLAQA